MATAGGFSVWNALERLGDPVYKDVRFYVPLVCTVSAAILSGFDKHFAGKKSKRDGKAVSEDALELLTDLETAMGRLTDSDKFQAYFTDVVQKCGPKLFRERKVRIGFFVLEGGEAEDGALVYLKKRAALDLNNGMPLSYYAGDKDADNRDHAKEMIDRTRLSKDLCVPNIYKDSDGWKRLVNVKKTAYNCFVSAPVLDSKKLTPLGLLTVDAPKVGDLTSADREWVRVLAGMLSHGLKDETADVPKPKSPLTPVQAKVVRSADATGFAGRTP